MTDIRSEDQSLPISRVELISLLAMLSATVAFSIDAMLPSLPAIGRDLSPGDANRTQLVVASFVLGLGVGTLFAGPLCDAFGRKVVSALGAAIYATAALIGALANDLDLLLAARVVQGLGAAGPRVAAIAIVRDLFSGRQMAQIVSYIIFVFSLTPIIAPSLGALIAWAFGWRAVFLSFAVFAGVSMLWLMLRLPETLPPNLKRPFRLEKLADGVRQVVANRQVVLATLAQTLIFSTLFGTLMSSQQVFGEVFDRGNEFPLWFGAMALIASTGSLINARIVMRLGMREVVRRTLLAHAIGSLAFLCLQLTGVLSDGALFAIALCWMTSVFFLAAFGIGNMNALAMEPMGHIAGMAASIVTAFATIGSAVLAVPIGLAFDGTMRPLTFGVFAVVSLAYLIVRKMDA